MFPLRVSVKTAPPYDVVIGRDVLDHLCGLIDIAIAPTSVLLITDSNVAPLHLSAVRQTIDQQTPVVEFVVPAGEGSKSLEQLGLVFDHALESGQLDRGSAVIALGGGVIGDLAGFAAATLLRGLRWVQVPTTLLAMVDSSVGGKVAINHSAGKNLIGAFHQPAGVFADLAFLDTLPEREYVSGLAEVAKAALLAGGAAWSTLEAGAAALRARDHGMIGRVVADAVQFKAEVVAQDEHDVTGRRALLNLGHTLAHALEALRPGKWLHGETVAIGLHGALRMSMACAGLAPTTAARVATLLDALGLPSRAEGVDAAELPPLLAVDKKRQGEMIMCVVLRDIGEAVRMPWAPDMDLADVLIGTNDG